MALNDAVPSSATDVFKRNAEDTDRLLNQTANVVNRVGTTLETFPSSTGRVSTAADAAQVAIQADVDAAEAAKVAALSSYAQWNSRGDWATATAYANGDIWNNTATSTWYLVLNAYTSGATVNDDIAGPNITVLQGAKYGTFEGLSDAVAFVAAHPELFPDNTAVSTSSYRTPAECLALSIPYPDGGGASYVVVAGGTGIDDGGSYHDMANGNQLELVRSDTISINVFGAREGVDISPIFDAVLLYAGKQAKITALPLNYIIDSEVRVVEKGRPDNGVFEIDLSGSVITGTGGFVFDSCKNLSVIGLQAPTQNMILRGVWFSNFRNCKASKLINADQNGLTFTSCYWNDFHTCVFQTIVRGASESPVNAYSFYGVNLRGNTGQGFTETADYSLIFEGASNSANAQNWCFYGGDISYPIVGVIDTSASAEGADIELTFNGVYFDSEIPDAKKTDGYIMSTINCHHANASGFSANNTAASRGAVDLHRADRVLKLSPDNNHNLVPYGDFSTVVDDPNKYFILNNSGGTVDTSRGGPYGQIATLFNATSGSFFIRCKPSQVQGICTATILLRSSTGFGTQRVKVGFGFGQTRRFHEFDVTEEWSIYTLTDPIEGAAGTVPSITISNALAAGSWEIEVGMISASMGAGGGTRGATITPQGAVHTELINPPNISPGDVYFQTVTVKGAAVGDSVSVTAENGTYNDLIMLANVISDNTVRLKIWNPSVGVIDPANAEITFVCKSHVIK